MVNKTKYLHLTQKFKTYLLKQNSSPLKKGFVFIIANKKKGGGAIFNPKMKNTLFI